MKKIFLIITIAFLYTGCTEDLDRFPLDTISESTYWNTRGDAISAVNGIYNVLADNNMYGGFMMHTDAISNNAYSPNSFSNILEISEGTGFDASSTFPRTIWGKCYEGIVRANRVLEKIPNIEMDETLKSRLIVEAKFLRAMFYFHLTNLYGDVPLILNIQTIDESLVSRDPKASVITQIILDLNDAASGLPDSYSGSDLGRVTKGAAIALKSRVHLYNKQYAEAIIAANQVIGYDLVSLGNFPKIFLPDLENNNAESIFEVQFLGATGTGNIGSSFNNQSGSMVAFGGPLFSPVQNLVDAYSANDLRLSVTLVQPGEVFGGETYSGTTSKTAFAFTKHVIADPAITGDGDANFVVIRYAEVLLNLAEAENELNGSSGAYASINKIRNRAGLIDLPPGLTKEQMRDAIKLERRLELAFEGHHFFDLLRYGAADYEAAMLSVNGSVSGHNRVFEPRLMLWPVPQTSINVNPNLLPQNAGW